MKTKYRAILRDKTDKKISRIMNQASAVYCVGDQLCFSDCDDVLEISRICHYGGGDIGVFFTVDNQSVGALTVSEMLEKIMDHLGIKKYEN